MLVSHWFYKVVRGQPARERKRRNSMSPKTYPQEPYLMRLLSWVSAMDLLRVDALSMVYLIESPKTWRVLRNVQRAVESQ